MRILACLSIALLSFAMPSGGAVEPVLHAACADAPTPELFAHWDTQIENLAFLGDELLVSDLGGDRLVRFATDGTLLGEIPVAGMHGIAIGPDGLAYAGATVGAGPGVVRFTSLDPPAREDVASGLVSANGMAFAPDGDLFVSNPGLGSGAPYLARLPAGDMADWKSWGETYGTNGLWPAGDRILSAITADQSSRIVSISTSDPSDVRVVADLTLGAITLQPGLHEPRGATYLAPKGLDDLTLAPDGMIYAAAHVTGELLRIDPATGAACAYASGLEEPTSVRVAPPGWGEHGGALFVTDMGGVGVTALFGPGEGSVWVLPVT